MSELVNRSVNADLSLLEDLGFDVAEVNETVDGDERTILIVARFDNDRVRQKFQTVNASVQEGDEVVGWTLWNRDKRTYLGFKNPKSVFDDGVDMAKFVAEGVRDDDPRVLKNPKWKHLKDNGRYEKITIHFENASEDNRARRLSKVESDQVEVEVAEGEGGETTVAHPFP